MLLRTLGALRLEGAAMTRRKPLLVLCLLALDGPQERGRLARLFWPDSDDPRNRLSVTLSRLRRADADLVHVDGDLIGTELATDVGRLEEALADGQADAVLEAYPGAFLGRSSLSDVSPEVEEWILARREAIAGEVRISLLRAADRAAAAEHFPEAARLAESAIGVAGAAPLAPARLPRVHALLLAADAPASAPVADDAAGLGVDLASSPAEARARLRDGLPRVDLPRAITSFLGRSRERAELRAILGDPDRPLVTLLGPGGIGKTRLALALAEDVAAGGVFPGGVTFVPLEAARNSADVGRAVATALGRPPRENERPLDAAARVVGGRRMLLVLDNVEHLAEAAVDVAELLARCRRLFVLATSRVRLDIEEESAYRLRGLRVPEVPPPVLEWGRHEAVRLFVERARRVRLDYAPDADDVASIVAIARAVGGAPLGIELAAAATRAMPVAAIAVALRGPTRDVPSFRSRNLAPRHRSLRGSFELSWRLLDLEEREALRRVTVFRTGFDARSAAGVADADEGTLEALHDASLVQRDIEGRYGLHPLVAAYAAERLAADPPVEARVRARHAAWVAETVARRTARFRGSEQAQALAALERVSDDLVAALTWANRHDPRIGLTLVGMLRSFWRYGGRLDEGRTHAEAALAAAPPDAVEERSAAAVAAGEMAYRQGDYAAARRHLEAALASARAAGAAPRIGQALEVLGTMAYAEHRLDEARACFERALVLADEVDDPAAELDAATGLGRVAATSGDLDGAAGHFDRVLTAATRIGAATSVATAHFNLGAVARDRGDLDTAERHFRRSLEADTALGDRGGAATVMHELAAIAYARGDLEAAAEGFAEVQERCRSMGDAPGAAKARYGLGLVEKRRGRHEVALQHYRVAVRAWFAMGNEAQVVPVVWALASLANARGRYLDAALLWGAEAALIGRLDVRRTGSTRDAHERDLAETRAHLEEAAFRHIWHEGLEANLATVLERVTGTADANLEDD